MEKKMEMNKAAEGKYSPNTPEISQILFWSPINGEQQLDQPADAKRFLLSSSMNQNEIQQLTQLRLGQQSGSNDIDQGCERDLIRAMHHTAAGKLPQGVMQQQLGTSRKRRRQSTPDSHSPEIPQIIPADRLARKRQNDKRYRDRIRQEKQQIKSDMDKLGTEYGRLSHEYQKMKSDMEKFGTEYEQLKHGYEEMKSHAEKLEAENGQLKDECQELKSENGWLKRELGRITTKYDKLKLEGKQTMQGRHGYSSMGSNDTFRSFTQGSGHPQCGSLSLTGTHQTFLPTHNTHMESICQTKDQRKSDCIALGNASLFNSGGNANAIDCFARDKSE